VGLGDLEGPHSWNKVTLVGQGANGLISKLPMGACLSA
jgi:hypothetical protein